MRKACAIVIVFLAGCSGSPTLQELEDQALVSGDWSAVEEREQLLERKGEGKALDCPTGYLSTCFEVGLRMECACVRAVAGRGISPQ